MVYLKEILKDNRNKFDQYKNIELVAYTFVHNSVKLSELATELSTEEELAFCGFKNEYVDTNEILKIIRKTPIKGISATSNIFKFAGLYLSAKEELKTLLNEKFSASDLKQKYFLCKIESSFLPNLLNDIKINNDDTVAIIIRAIYELESLSDEQINNALQAILSNDIDVPTQILLEDFESSLLKVKFSNKNADDTIRDILNNFSNAVQKIIKNRRKGKDNFQIKDEYDVQDILYVILKSIFPTLRDEDAVPKAGAKSTKIDFIIREEKILIEVKMMKEKDTNETNFIEELKVDFESYHQCAWLDKLYCFVYDPFKKTRDISNFQDLNGRRVKGQHEFDVEVIVTN